MSRSGKRSGAALAGAVLAVAALACGDAKPSAGAPGAAAPAASPGPGAPGGVASTGKNGCPHDGRWRPCALVERLEKAGLVVTPKPDTVRYDFLSVPGLSYTVGRGEVQAFFYDDTTKLARDVAALDTVQVAPKGTFRHWDVHPTFARSGNLVVILLTLSDVLMERGTLAVQAGAPQPEPPADASAQPLPPTRVP